MRALKLKHIGRTDIGDDLSRTINELQVQVSIDFTHISSAEVLYYK